MHNRLLIGDGYQLHLSTQSGVLRAQVEGASDFYVTAREYWKVIAHERRECDVHLVLVLENFERSGSFDEIIAVTDDLISLGFEGCKLAFVDRGDRNRSAHEHVAIRVREHGIVGGVFGQENEALMWLRHGED